MKKMTKREQILAQKTIDARRVKNESRVPHYQINSIQYANALLYRAHLGMVDSHNRYLRIKDLIFVH